MLYEHQYTTDYIKSRRCSQLFGGRQVGSALKVFTSQDWHNGSACDLVQACSHMCIQCTTMAAMQTMCIPPAAAHTASGRMLQRWAAWTGSPAPAGWPASALLPSLQPSTHLSQASLLSATLSVPFGKAGKHRCAVMQVLCTSARDQALLLYFHILGKTAAMPSCAHCLD